ncbi:MAG TPA: c-type cytochrome [Anaerolineales bacterium]|nr:c-type cytochrome [Anaerolineales bacterium]
MRRYRYPLVLLFALLLSACSFSLAEDITPPPGSEVRPPQQAQPAEVSGPLYPLVPPNPQAGQPIYAEKCAPCHGTSGLGDGPQSGQLPNPAAPIGAPEFARQATPADWYTQVTQGNLEKFMPPFNSLSDRQRWDVVAYSFSLSAPPVVVEQGEELYQANCADCHGEQGKGDGPQAQSLEAALPDLSSQAFMAEKSAETLFQAITQGVEPGMPAFAQDLTEAERWALAAYLRSLTFESQGEEPVTAQSDSTAESTSVPQGQVAPSSEITTTQEMTGSLETGIVAGNVINASGGAVPDDLVLTLYAFDSMQVVFTQTMTIQPDEKFAFEPVEMPAERAFLVTTEYNGNTFSSDIGVVRADEKRLDMPVLIYDTTTDASILRVDRLHLFFEFIDPKRLRVIELYIMSNPSDKALVAASEGQPVVNFTLPEGATNLEFQEGSLGDRYIQTPDGFADTVTVRPGNGSYEVVYAYEMPYNRKLDLSKPVNLPVDAVVILIPEDGIKVKGEMLVDEGTRDMQGTIFHLYNGGSLQAGDQLSLTISGRPSSGSPSILSGSSTSLVVGVGGFGLALILAGVWLYRKAGKADTGGESDELDLPASDLEFDSAETVMDAIIALDDLYQSGELPEEAYQQRRAELKARLQALVD